MKRGDIVTAAPPGEFGKPRPVLVLQAFLDEISEGITVARITSDLLHLPAVRVTLEPSPSNGLQKASEVAVDNIQTFSVARIGPRIGSIDERSMSSVDGALRLHLGLL